MNWKISLDKYLTTPPDDGFDNWCEDVLGDKISNKFFQENENWILDTDGKCNEWLNKLFNRGVNERWAAQVIERAFRFYFSIK